MTVEYNFTGLVKFFLDFSINSLMKTVQMFSNVIMTLFFNATFENVIKN